MVRRRLGYNRPMKEKTAALQAELEAIIAWFESEEADLDKAVDKYERGLLIAKELEKRLQVTENSVNKLQKLFG